jgi:hypothetical protein
MSAKTPEGAADPIHRAWLLSESSIVRSGCAILSGLGPLGAFDKAQETIRCLQTELHLPD